MDAAAATLGVADIRVNMGRLPFELDPFLYMRLQSKEYGQIEGRDGWRASVMACRMMQEPLTFWGAACSGGLRTVAFLT